MRTHYGPWQPCWISNQHQKHKSGRGPSSVHFWEVWLISVLRFQRRRFKCEKLPDGRTTDAYPWQKLTWPMARWAKNMKKKEATFLFIIKTITGDNVSLTSIKMKTIKFKKPVDWLVKHQMRSFILDVPIFTTRE